MVGRPYQETVAGLHRYGKEINVGTPSTRLSTSMETNSDGQSYTLHIWNLMNSFRGPVASITARPGREHTTKVSVLSDSLGTVGSSLGSRNRELEKVKLNEFTNFLAGKRVETNNLFDLRLRY